MPLISLFYYFPLGMLFRKICVSLVEPLEALDAIPLVLAFICWGLNVAVDCFLNVWRQEASNCYRFDTDTAAYYGMYVKSSVLKERLARFGIYSLNYMFELLEWVCFAFFCKQVDAWWVLLSTFLILVPRMAWASFWRREAIKLYGC